MARGTRQQGGTEVSRTVLLVVTLALVLLGLVMVYSASVGEALTGGSTDSSSYLIKQGLFAVVGIVLAFIIWKVFPAYVLQSRAFLWLMIAVTYVLLLLTIAIGFASHGAQRWIYIGGFSLQPSEFIKIALVLIACKLYSDYREGLEDSKTLFFYALISVVFPMGLILVTQSDLGTTLILIVGILAVLWFGEAPLKMIGFIIALCAVVAVIAVLGSSYRSGRLYFADPWADGQNGAGKGFQLVRSFYAFSEGGIFGVGIGNSAEKLTPLPEAETDFIFAIIGEELGLIGAIVVIVLFLIFLFAGLQVAHNSEDPFSCMLAGSLTIMLVTQAFINIACVTGLIPTTGKPLPFISSGGSSMLASLIMVGLIMTAAPVGGGSSIYDKRREDLHIVRRVGK